MTGKGRPISIVSGTYKGHQGYLDTSKGETDHGYWVVILDWTGKKKNKPPKDEWTWLKKSSIRFKKTTLNSYEEAALYQNPDVDIKMDQLVAMLAQFDVDPDDNKFGKIFNEKLNRAIAAQEALGYKARWRRVKYR